MIISCTQAFPEFARRRHEEEAAKRKTRAAEIGPWEGRDLKIWDVIDWTPQYIVFFDLNLDLDYRFDKKINAVSDFNGLLNRSALLETSISPDLPEYVRIYCKRLIGEGMSCAIEEDFDNARFMLESAGTFILARNREQSRIWYLTYCSFVALPFIVLGILAWLTIHHKKFDYFSSDFLWLVACAGAGAVGALLSVISRTGSLEFDAIAGRKLHLIESASRIATGVISGVLAGFAIKSGLVPKQLFDNQGPYMLLISACAVGAGERYVTSIISDVNSLGLRGKDSKLPDSPGQRTEVQGQANLQPHGQINPKPKGPIDPQPQSRTDPQPNPQSQGQTNQRPQATPQSQVQAKPATQAQGKAEIG